MPAPATLRLRRGLNLRRLVCIQGKRCLSRLGAAGRRLLRCWGAMVRGLLVAMAAGGLLFPTAATAGADVPVGPAAHAVRSARAAGATVVDLTEKPNVRRAPWRAG